MLRSENVDKCKRDLLLLINIRTHITETARFLNHFWKYINILKKIISVEPLHMPSFHIHKSLKSTKRNVSVIWYESVRSYMAKLQMLPKCFLRCVKKCSRFLFDPSATQHFASHQLFYHAWIDIGCGLKGYILSKGIIWDYVNPVKQTAEKWCRLNVSMLFY